MRRLLKLSNKDYEASLKKESYLDQVRYTRILYYTAEEEKKLLQGFIEDLKSTTRAKTIEFGAGKIALEKSDVKIDIVQSK